MGNKNGREKRDNGEFYKIVVVPVIRVLTNSESLTAKTKDWTRRQTIEMIFLRSVKVYTKIDIME
jgi:hypothetical protein